MPSLKKLFALLFTLLLTSCSSPEANDVGSPETALTTFISAMHYGSTDDIWTFLGPNTRSALEARVNSARALGIDETRPAFFLIPTWLPTEAEIETVERLETTENTTTLQITTYLGHISEVMILRVEEGWQIELNIPDVPSPQ